MAKFWAMTVCLPLLELFQISFRHFVVLKLSFGVFYRTATNF